MFNRLLLTTSIFVITWSCQVIKWSYIPIFLVCIFLDTLGIDRSDVMSFYQIPDRCNIFQSLRVVKKILTRYF